MTGDARMMRCYGRDHKHRRRRFNERATGRERIVGGPRRRSHDPAGIAVLTRFGRFRLDGVDGSVARNVSRKVEHQAVSLARCKTAPPAHDLHIQTRRLGGAQHGNQIYRRRIETGRQHIGIGQALNTPSLEVVDDGLALGTGCISHNRLAGHTSAAHRITHVVRVVHARTKDQPAFAVC